MTFLDMIELYNIRKGNDLNNLTAIFEDIVLDDRLDKETLGGVLLDQCGAMHCIYESTATFKYFSDNFFKKYAWNIGKLVDSLEFKYNPIENKNLKWTETTVIEQNLDTTENTEEERTKNNLGTQSTVYNENVDNTGTQKNEYEEDETNTISAMNSSAYQPDNKRETSGENTRTDNLSQDTDGTSTRTDNLREAINANNDRTKNEDLNWDETDTHTESGIVDTAYQDLIEKERKQAKFNVYNWISDRYAKELFLLVY